MSNEAVMLKHVAESEAVDANDTIVNGSPATKILAKALIALAQKLDADSTDTGGDSDYEATIAALTL